MGVEVILVQLRWTKTGQEKLQDVCGIVSKSVPSLFGVCLGMFVVGWCVCLCWNMMRGCVCLCVSRNIKIKLKQLLDGT